MHSKNCRIVSIFAVLSFLVSAITGFVLWLLLPVVGVESRGIWLNVHIYSSLIFVGILIFGFATGCNYCQEVVNLLRGKWK